MGVPTFVVDMSVVRCGMATLVPDAFAGMHYLSMFGSVNYASVLPESMQKLVSRWLYRHGFPGSSDVMCACVERKIIELAYVSVEKLVLIEHWQRLASVLDVLDRLRCESWSLYNALVERMSLVVYGVDAWPISSSPVPVTTLSCWRRVHDVVASLDLAVGSSVFVPMPLIAEKAMSL